VGKDGRRYLLDLARSFPPESPMESVHLKEAQQAVFYRYEYVCVCVCVCVCECVCVHVCDQSLIDTGIDSA